MSYEHTDLWGLQLKCVRRMGGFVGLALWGVRAENGLRVSVTVYPQQLEHEQGLRLDSV